MRHILLLLFSLILFISFVFVCLFILHFVVAIVACELYAAFNAFFFCYSVSVSFISVYLSKLLYSLYYCQQALYMLLTQYSENKRFTHFHKATNPFFHETQKSIEMKVRKQVMLVLVVS